MSLEITISTSAFDGLQHELAPLITVHQGRLWDAYLELDEDGGCSIAQSAPWDNSVSVDVWHGRTRRWPLPARVAGRPLHAVLTSLEVLELLQRVHLGHSIEWDGNNFRGVLDEDAQDAFDSLEAIIGELANDESSQWVVWDADEWLAQATLEEVWPEGLSLQEAALEQLAQAKSQDAWVGGPSAMRAALVAKVQAALDDDEDFEPTPEQAAALN